MSNRMALVKVIVIYCDYPGCPRRYVSNTENLELTKLQAFGMDWNENERGENFCPRHGMHSDMFNEPDSTIKKDNK